MSTPTGSRRPAKRQRDADTEESADVPVRDESSDDPEDDPNDPSGPDPDDPNEPDTRTTNEPSEPNGSPNEPANGTNESPADRTEGTESNDGESLVTVTRNGGARDCPPLWLRRRRAPNGRDDAPVANSASTGTAAGAIPIETPSAHSPGSSGYSHASTGRAVGRNRLERTWRHCRQRRTTRPTRSR